MSVSIIIKGGATHKKDNRSMQDFHIDKIHSRRKELESTMRNGIFTVDQMNQRDCKSKSEESKRVADYDRWKVTQTKTGQNNAKNMREWSDINLELKRRGEEGKPQCIDFVRQRKSTKYE